MTNSLMELILVRHGKSAHNLGTEQEHHFAGSRVDLSLAPEGVENARLLAKKLKEAGGCDLIISSTLKRSRETAEIIAKELNMSVSANISELSEIDIGDFAGHTEGEVKKIFPEEAKLFYDGDVVHWRFPHGEDYGQVRDRLKIALEKIKNISKGHRRVLVVGHGMVNRIFFHEMLPERNDLWQQRSYPHDRIVTIPIKLFIARKYCYCDNKHLKEEKCLICRSFDKGIDNIVLNSDAPNKYRIVITGTNGKTTLTNVIGSTLNDFYKDDVAYASSTGIYGGDEKLVNIEHKASEHYVYLLNQKKYKIIISEQPEAGIYYYGLPINHQIGIITNITHDHLERPWVKSGIDDIYKIKSVVAENASEKCITSLDYPLTRRLVGKLGAKRFALFTRDKKQIDDFRGKTILCSDENGTIFIYDGIKKKRVAETREFLITLDDALVYNIENILAIICLLYSSSLFNKDFLKLVDILKNKTLSFKTNPARFNVMEYKDRMIILDYAHNVDGYQHAINSLKIVAKRFKKTKIIGLTSIATDRSKKTVVEIADMLVRGFNHVYIRQIKENKNAELLSSIVESAGKGSPWEKGFDDFVEKYSAPDTLLYLSIAGHGQIMQLESMVERLGIIDYDFSRLKE